MVKKTSKGLFSTNPFENIKGPKTATGKMNKIMTGDGRKKYNPFPSKKK